MKIIKIFLPATLQIQCQSHKQLNPQKDENRIYFIRFGDLNPLRFL